VKAPTHKLSAMLNLNGQLVGNTPTKSVLRNTTNAAVSSYDAFLRLTQSNDPTITEGARFKRISEASAKLRSKHSDQVNEIYRAKAFAKEDVQKRINDKVKLVPDQFAAETRQYYRSLDEAGRHKLLRDLALENNGPALAALVDAPKHLTGIQSEHAGRYRVSVR